MDTTARSPDSPAAAVPERMPVWPLAVLTLPFLLNDLGNIFVDDARWWVLQDYAWRVLVLGLLAWMISRRAVTGEHLRRGQLTITGVAWMTFTCAVGIWIIDGPGRALLELWPQSRVGVVPPILSRTLLWLDLTFGLALVAFSEEFVFRGVLLPRLSAALRSEWAGLASSSVLFGLVHWSLGAGVVLQATLIGVLLGLCVWRAGNVYFAVAAHFVINLVTALVHYRIVSF